VGNDQPITIGELAGLVRAQCGSNSPIELVPYADAYGPGFEDLGRRRPDLLRLERLTGFRPVVSLKEIVVRLSAGESVGDERP
jgi:UDP-glucose 4-epimerase